MPDTATTSLIEITDAGENVIGRFPEGAVCAQEAAAFDPKTNIYYAYLAPGGVVAMDVSTGHVLWAMPFAKQAEDILVHDFAIDPVTGKGYAAVSILKSTAPVTWSSYIASVDFGAVGGPTLTRIGEFDDVFGSVIAGKCSQPGTSPGAAKLCYGQVNDGFVDVDGIYWLTAFTAGPPEYVLGADTVTGGVVFEGRPDNGGGNVIDMAHISKPAPSQTRVA